MSVTQIATNRLYKEVEELCTKRNTNVPVELGKCLYVPLETGVELHKASYLLDSRHSEYTSPVAQILFDEGQQHWLFFIARFDGENYYWEPYSALTQSAHLEDILNEIEHDPAGCFW